MKRIENISRRGFLKNVFSAGALVLGARLLPIEALAALEGAEFQPNIWIGLQADGTLRIVTQSLGDGNRHPQQPASRGRRRDGSGLEPCQVRAGDR